MQSNLKYCFETRFCIAKRGLLSLSALHGHECDLISIRHLVPVSPFKPGAKLKAEKFYLWT